MAQAIITGGLVTAEQKGGPGVNATHLCPVRPSQAWSSISSVRLWGGERPGVRTGLLESLTSPPH